VPIPAAVPARTLDTVAGTRVPVPQPDRLVHLQFRRFAGCPVCNLHLRSIVNRLGEIEDAGIREVVVFHSSADALRTYTADLPLDVVADPGRALYREFGVESGPRALLDPRAWPTIARAVARELRAVRRRERPAPPVRPEGGRLGLPADFLIAPDGRVAAAKYGAHVDDQWSVDELLTLASSVERERVADLSRRGGPGCRPASDAPGAG
jgi:AhpC/TSA family